MPNNFANNPTSASVGFDWNSFSWGFAIMDVIPTVNKAIMEREFQKVEAGQAVALIINLQDIMTSPGQRFNFDVTTQPQIEIYNPDNTTKVAFVNMNHIGQVGYYNYQHQTLTTDFTGIYTARFKSVNGTMTCLTDKMVVFEITPFLQIIPSSGMDFYFAIGTGTNPGTFALYLFTSGNPNGILVVDNIEV